MIKQSIITITTLGLLSVTAFALDTTGCTSCHGKNFEKAAMGKSKIVKDMSKDDIEKALKGYKDGSYGGTMKNIMQAQVSKLSDEEITEFAKSFTKTEEINPNEPSADAKKAPAKEVDVTACTSCHGQNFEKVAMGKSKKVNEMSKADIVIALTGYKKGSYGGSMKTIMKSQADKLSVDDIAAIAEKIGK